MGGRNYRNQWLTVVWVWSSPFASISRLNQVFQSNLGAIRNSFRGFGSNFPGRTGALTTLPSVCSRGR